MIEGVFETFLEHFLVYGTGIFALGFLIACGVLMLKYKHHLKRKYLVFAVVAFLCGVGMLLANFPVNMILFDRINQRAFQTMRTSLEETGISGKTKEFILKKYGKPSSRKKSPDGEKWYYSPGPWFTYGSLDTIVIIFKESRVKRWSIDVF